MERCEGPKVAEKQPVEEFLDHYFPSPTSPERQTPTEETITIERAKLEELVAQGESLETILHSAIERGYILHGSPNDTAVLEPRQATGLGRESARLRAVYATDSARIAMFGAITSKDRVEKLGKPFRTEWGVSRDQDSRITSIGFGANRYVQETLGDGYIYVLRREDFVPNEIGEYIRKKEYVPPVKIPVKREDFKYPIRLIPEEKVTK